MIHNALKHAARVTATVILILFVLAGLFMLMTGCAKNNLDWSDDLEHIDDGMRRNKGNEFCRKFHLC